MLLRGFQFQGRLDPEGGCRRRRAEIGRLSALAAALGTSGDRGRRRSGAGACSGVSSRLTCFFLQLAQRLPCTKFTIFVWIRYDIVEKKLKLIFFGEQKREFNGKRSKVGVLSRVRAVVRRALSASAILCAPLRTSWGGPGYWMNCPLPPLSLLPIDYQSVQSTNNLVAYWFFDLVSSQRINVAVIVFFGLLVCRMG